jgi:hypothetical protein
MDEKTIVKKFTVDFVEDDDEQLAEAAIAANHSFNYLKFILTDDEPNANRQRIPKDEFENLIRTGFFTPLKMARGGIREGHDLSEPLGVITHLKKYDNQIRGLAALWSEERPDDVKFLKEAYSKKRPLNISWELGYTASTFEEDGTENLHGVTLRAATLVDLPAYKGRTPVIQVASEQKEDTDLDELEKLQKELDDTKEALSEANDELKTLKEQIKEFEGQAAELETLREFKEQIDKEVEAEKALDAIKDLFTEAGVEKDEEYFAENRERLLAMSQEDIEFMLQEIVAFSAKEEEEEEEDDEAGLKVPNARNKQEKTLTPQEIARKLKESRASQ